jgi:hypothetical protein
MRLSTFFDSKPTPPPRHGVEDDPRLELRRRARRERIYATAASI